MPLQTQETITQKIIRKNIPSIKKQPIVETKNFSSLLTIAFNPEYIHIDSTILDMLETQVDSTYFQSKVTPLNLLIDTERKEPRGQVVGNKLILSSRISTDSERMKVFVHELGHIVDIHFLHKGLLGDPSDRFYDISWDAYNIKKKGMKMGDFVSGYALSNKYEDFAESFSFYVFHNDTFRERALRNTSLRKKYDFFKTYVFDREEFIGTSFGNGVLKSYNWDTTRIPVDMKKYLYYIK